MSAWDDSRSLAPWSPPRSTPSRGDHRYNAPLCPQCRAPSAEATRFCVPCGDRFYLAWCLRFPLDGRPRTLAEVVRQREESARYLAAHRARSFAALAERLREYTAANFRAFLEPIPWERPARALEPDSQRARAPAPAGQTRPSVRREIRTHEGRWHTALYLIVPRARKREGSGPVPLCPPAGGGDRAHGAKAIGAACLTADGDATTSPAIGGSDAPEPHASANDEGEIDVLCLSPDQFARSPQVGTPRQMSWPNLVAYLSRPTEGDPARFPDPDEAKRQAGAWSPCLYRDNRRRKADVIRACAITFDIDGCGDVERACAAFAPFRKIIHSTYKSTADAPRCRVVVPLAAPCSDPRQYETAHAIIRRELAARGFIVDEGAKDISRLNFAPMVYPGRSFAFRATEGVALDVAKFAAAAKPPAPPKPPPKLEHRNAYAQAAMRRAASALSAAAVGDRHHLLSREAYTLARPALGLSLDEIRSALLEAFVGRAGEGRRREAERCIGDAFRASRGEP